MVKAVPHRSESEILKRLVTGLRPEEAMTVALCALHTIRDERGLFVDPRPYMDKVIELLRDHSKDDPST